MVEFLKKLISFFNQYDIPYMLSGSMAMSLYALPRMTRDFDFVVHLKKTDVNKLTEYFQSGYYCDEDSIREAIKDKGMFNIIDHASGYKADFVILKDEPFRQAEFDRRREEAMFGMDVYVVSMEDLLISKLIWIQDFQSPQQMEDIKALKKNPRMDWAYINDWIASMKLNTFDLLLS